VAQVVRDPFTDDLMFDVDYLQVFGNGGDGTMSGGQSWMHYMGSMRRGFMGTRPISDVLVRLDTLTEDYDFGGTKLSFFNELLAQLSLVGARYRIGDGSGDSTITSATSCVQDSAQALFITLRRFQNKIESNPQYVQWMRDNPNHPTTLRFKKLVALGKDLAVQLTPFGVVRWDWAQNADVLTGVATDTPFISIDNFRPRNLLTGLISWRTALPRQAHDEFAKIFLLNGASLWFLRPNQIGGNDPTIAPLEATLIFGAWKIPGTQIPWLSFLIMRVFGAATIPSAGGLGADAVGGSGTGGNRPPHRLPRWPAALEPLDGLLERLDCRPSGTAGLGAGYRIGVSRTVAPLPEELDFCRNLVGLGAAGFGIVCCGLCSIRT